MAILGRDINTGRLIQLGADARARGVYVIGATGTGKTTLLQSIAYQDITAGHGVCVLDPHGDMIDWLLARIPIEREKDTILFDPSDEDFPFGLNLLYREDPDSRRENRWVVSTIMATLQRLNEWSWGPRLEHVLGHTLWTAMTRKDATLIEVLLLLTDEQIRTKWVSRLKEPMLLNFWNEFPERDKERLEFIASTVNKLTPFLLDEGMRHIVGQSENSIKLRKLMDTDKVLLVNLSKGQLGEHNSAILGSVIINLILMAALSRRDKTLEERKVHPFHVIVDEYQNFAGDSFSVLQSEARKYAVDLVVAHQFRDQLTIETRGSALNVGNFITFRTTGVDGPELASQFDNTPPPPTHHYEPARYKSVEIEGRFMRGSEDVQVDDPQRLYSDMMMQKANELTNQPPFHFEARIIEPDPDHPRRLRLAEYKLETIDPEGEESAELVKKVYGKKDENRPARIQAESRRLARPREVVAAEIRRRTLNRASMGPSPRIEPVPASEIVEGEESDPFWGVISSAIMADE